tara:strand:+ start:1320 stop:1499 length:180 start_codon:yes stop_codon:yes gene_type:complete
MRKKLIKLYLLYWSEFITIGAFADYINANGLYDSNKYLDDKKVLRIIRLGRKLYLQQGL